MGCERCNTSKSISSKLSASNVVVVITVIIFFFLLNIITTQYYIQYLFSPYTYLSRNASRAFTSVTKQHCLHILEKRGLHMLINGLSCNIMRNCCVLKRVRCVICRYMNRKCTQFFTEVFLINDASVIIIIIASSSLVLFTLIKRYKPSRHVN